MGEDGSLPPRLLRTEPASGTGARGDPVTQRPLVYVVILNWNGWRDTVACVESCRELTWPNYRVLVVDNGSTDGSEELLRARLPEVRILQSGRNLGFSGGNNVGIRYALDAGAEYVWLLNNDAEAAPEALEALVDALESTPTAAAATSKIFLHDDRQRLQFAGGLWEKGRLRLRLRGTNEVDRGQFDDTLGLGSASGCSMLLRASVIREIGLMDESYFLYWEDTEWCARAQRSGYLVRFAPKSHVWHKVSATARQSSFGQSYYFVRNGFFFLLRYDPVLLPLFTVTSILSCLKCLLARQSPAARGHLRGFVDFLRGRRGAVAST
jgi:GT2 family glycosyltransferase